MALLSLLSLLVYLLDTVSIEVLDDGNTCTCTDIIDMAPAAYYDGLPIPVLEPNIIVEPRRSKAEDVADVYDSMLDTSTDTRTFLKSHDYPTHYLTTCILQ